MFYFWIRRKIFLPSVRHFLFTSLLPFLPLFFYTCLCQSLFNPNIFFSYFIVSLPFLLALCQGVACRAAGTVAKLLLSLLCFSMAVHNLFPFVIYSCFAFTSLLCTKPKKSSLRPLTPIQRPGWWLCRRLCRRPLRSPMGNRKAAAPFFFSLLNGAYGLPNPATLTCFADKIDWPTGRLVDWEGGIRPYRSRVGFTLSSCISAAAPFETLKEFSQLKTAISTLVKNVNTFQTIIDTAQNLSTAGIN